MANTRTTIDIGDSYGLQKAVNKYLEVYSKDISKEIEESIDEVSKEAVQKLKDTSPKRKKGGGSSYAKHWDIQKSKKRLVFESTIYNKKTYRLTHLLEYGHDIKRNDAKVGEAKAKPHIEKVNDYVQTELIRRIQQKIKSGG